MSSTGALPATPSGAPAAIHSIEAARAPAASAVSAFSSLLASEQQLAAAREVLATLPAPIVYSLRDQAGSPAESVDRLFEVLRDGSFTPPAGPLGAPGSIIGATAHAATLFESPAQLWAAMRTALADPAGVASTFRAPPSVPSPAGSPATLEVHTLADAERLLASLPPSSSSPHASMAHAGWWEAALRFLLGARFPA